MKSKFRTAAMAAMAVTAISLAGSAYASTATIAVQQDGFVSADGSWGNNSWNTYYDWVGTGTPNFNSIFGFNVSSIPTGATITDVTFTAYHNYTANTVYGAPDDNALVGAAIGSNNSWNYTTVTTYNSFGPVLATLDENSTNLNAFQSWNLGAVSLSGGYLTVGLLPVTTGWNDYQPVTGNPSLGAYLTVTYNAVPEPATWAMLLLGMGGLGMALRSRRRMYGFAAAA